MGSYIQQETIQIFLFQYKIAFIVFGSKLGYFADAFNCAETYLLNFSVVFRPASI